ncbi:hypothetical protein V8G54_005991 [Vigna mungo]|uniref:Uncharacterized protein n=1 Tax=Vigna mungo TaxID=3915 RepID=A0AAQ3S458_VIGMU
MNSIMTRVSHTPVPYLTDYSRSYSPICRFPAQIQSSHPSFGFRPVLLSHKTKHLSPSPKKIHHSNTVPFSTTICQRERPLFSTTNAKGNIPPFSTTNAKERTYSQIELGFTTYSK